MSKTKIQTTIPTEIYKEAKKNGWKLNELFILGFQAKQDNPQLLKRIEELEKLNDSFDRRIRNWHTKLAYVQQQIEAKK